MSPISKMKRNERENVHICQHRSYRHCGKLTAYVINVARVHERNVVARAAHTPLQYCTLTWWVRARGQVHRNEYTVEYSLFVPVCYVIEPQFQSSVAGTLLQRSSIAV
ncbi:unnamed protein product [Toxocara canis]|uniref:Uncharacterized protein n=1 Tax=Toxocara canis TaxID=6265 RepID=A0A183UXK6_TOXCA|nr:unnamed protein product [Toxocara canis]